MQQHLGSLGACTKNLGSLVVSLEPCSTGVEEEEKTLYTSECAFGMREFVGLGVEICPIYSLARKFRTYQEGGRRS